MQEINDTIADIQHGLTKLKGVIQQSCHPSTGRKMTDVGADVLGDIAEFAGQRVPGARVETVTYPLVSCLTKEGDIIKGCKNVRDSMRIIHSAVFDFVQEHLHMIAWIDVMVEVDVGFESELSNVASRTYRRPGAMQKNEFNQWYMGDRVREKIRASLDSLDFFVIFDSLESELYFGIQLFNSVSTENAQRLLQRLTQALQSTIPDDRWRGFQFSPVVEVVELPRGMSSNDFGLYIECHLQYRYDDERQGPMTREGFPLLG
jgi:hypothetical protein